MGVFTYNYERVDDNVAEPSSFVSSSHTLGKVFYTFSPSLRGALSCGIAIIITNVAQ